MICFFLVCSIACYAFVHAGKIPLSKQISGQNKIGISVEGIIVIPDGSKVGNTRVVLNGGQFETLTRADGSFVFHFPPKISEVIDYGTISEDYLGFPNGIYSIDVLSTHSWFSTLKMKILVDEGVESISTAASGASNSIHVVEYKYPGAPRLASNYPLVLTALLSPSGSQNAVSSSAHQEALEAGTAGTNVFYFQPKKQFNIMGYMMANPMMLMMGFMVIMMVVMPKMMEGMDPEELKKMQEARGGDDPMKALQSLIGGGVSKNNEEDDD